MSALKLCPTCGSEYPANERFCPRDGTALRSQGGSGTDLVGSIIAERYHVIRKLGEGGMGQVYLAEHVKMGRKSAVKVMNPGMVHDADAISRFNREAANASRINHPNVAGIYDFGETADGLIYLAMEFIEGESLTAVVEANGALPAVRAARITKQAADGLQQAHDMGIVHRDLKPDNIMIAKNRDGSDCVKVVDFGIAKAAGSDAQKVTRTGMVVGTPEYMSPEQLAGDKLDGRSDIYSLALVTFNMLTGKLPFPSETVQESMIMRLTERPRSLTAMTAMEWPPEVEAVMQRALERDAKLRFQSASEFGDALYAAIERMPASALSHAGTLVLDASALPQTRLAPATPIASSTPAPAAPAPVVGPMANKAPMLVGGGLAAAALLGGAFFLMQGKGSVAPAAAPAAPVSTAVAQPAPSASLPTTTGAGPREPAGTSAPSVQSSGAPRDVPVASAPVVADRLPALLEESAAEGTAESALATARSLAPRASRTGEVVGLALVRAQALGMLGRDAESCSELRAVERKAGDTPYASRITQLLKASC